ncbi:MMPL family transporter [Pseudonocardia abyssalis]|uniref:MMPL family transporter n=1 Tax=Pseudonocardia abyssalis TaxID=2792008 RepID=A0ABS6URC5_9PSEU|nr:MMPL family transporter [Pseudonocardia abyssalis]MBW0113740.1 MMPL family transporter [Pseudonocardia abyssalis]MBW0134813.1 MMPL family transporter [Pseudonocardia abyssalis]
MTAASGWRSVRPGRRRLVGAAAVLVAVAFLAGGLVRLEVATGVDSFVPSSDPAIDQFDGFARSFGADPVVVLLESAEPRRLLEGERLLGLLKLEGQLAGLPDVAAVYGPATILNQVAGRSQDLLAELAGRRQGIRQTAEATARRGGVSESEALAAADRASAEFDTRYGSLLAQGLPAGLPTIRNDSFVAAATYDPTGQPRPQWRFVVPSDRSAAVLVRPRQGLGQAETERLVERVRTVVASAGLEADEVTVSGVPSVVAALGEQVRKEVPLVGGLAIAAVALCFFLTPWTSRRRRLLPVVTTLLATAAVLATLGWIGRPTSLGVVAFLPVLLGIGSYYPTYFAQHAGRRVVVVVAFATACSFWSLLLSPLPFVRDLGLVLGLGVLAACGVGALLIRTAAVTAPQPAPAPSPDLGPQRATSSRRTRSAVLVAAGLVALCGWVALPTLPLQADFDSFIDGLPAGAQVDELQQALGSTGEVDIVLRGPDVTSPEALAWMQTAQETVITGHGDRLRPAISAPTLLGFLGVQPSTEQITSGLRLLPPYLVGSVIGADHTVAALVFGSTVEDAVELQVLRDEVLGSLPPPPASFEVEITGLPMLAARAHELVSGDRYLANLAGVAAAGLVLAVGLGRRRPDAARAVAAAVIATGVGLLLIRLVGLPLNPVTVALGSLTAAVGCEFTVMLTEARRRAHRGLRRSVLLAAATSAVGYLVLAVSGLGAIREFGLLLAGSVLLALAAAQLVIWAWPVPVAAVPEPVPADEPAATVNAVIGVG